MPRDDDDRQRDVALGQLTLQVEAAHPAQAHIDHEARRAVAPWFTQKSLCRSKRPDIETYRSEEALEGLADGSVIFDHEHDRVRPADGLLPSGFVPPPHRGGITMTYRSFRDHADPSPRETVLGFPRTIWALESLPRKRSVLCTGRLSAISRNRARCLASSGPRNDGGAAD
jgi:hypothetical protein